MRWIAISIVLACAAATATAQVQLTVRADGRKVISNFGESGRTSSNYRWLAKQRDRRSAYDALIERYASQYGVDPILVRAVIVVESDFNPHCVSNKGARGLMQLTPETARRYGVKSIFDPEQNIRGGIHYLCDLLEMFHSDLPRVLAAYNAGEGAVLKYSGIPPYAETSAYVKRALTVFYGRPWGGTISLAGFNGAKLRGGFGRDVVAPVAATMLPQMRYLGTR